MFFIFCCNELQSSEFVAFIWIPLWNLLFVSVAQAPPLPFQLQKIFKVRGLYYNLHAQTGSVLVTLQIFTLQCSDKGCFQLCQKFWKFRRWWQRDSCRLLIVQHLFLVFMWRHHFPKQRNINRCEVLVLSYARPSKNLTFCNVWARQDSSLCNRVRLNFQVCALHDIKM